jgi:hypothetical protein
MKYAKQADFWQGEFSERATFTITAAIIRIAGAQPPPYLCAKKKTTSFFIQPPPFDIMRFKVNQKKSHGRENYSKPGSSRGKTGHQRNPSVGGVYLTAKERKERKDSFTKTKPNYC